MTLNVVGPSLMEVWTTGGLLGLIENTPENYAEWVVCCCGQLRCCCPGPSKVRCTFELISGPACPAIDGYVYEMDANALEPGQECYDTYHGPFENVGEGEIELELKCETTNVYSLRNVTERVFLNHPDIGSESGEAKFISGRCTPFLLIFEFEVTNGAATICNNETTNRQIVRVTITDISP